MSGGLERLLAPVGAGRLSLRNRVVMPAHTTNFGVGGRFSPQHVEYHRERAAGGVGLIITEGLRVHPTSLGRANTVAAFDDELVPSLAAVAAAVHAEGAKLAAQILHVGRQAGGHSSLSAAWGASAIPWSGTAAVPHEMAGDEIPEVVRGFGTAAARVVAAGVDAVEVHLGHGHLLQQFLSPASNRRTDSYGGSLGGRLRFAREAIESVLAAVPKELPILLRISGDEFVPGGLDVDQMLEAVGLLLADYRIDVLHVSHSAYLATGSVATQIADMSFPPQPFRHLPRAFAHAFPDVAVLAVCRLDTLEAAAELVDAGDAALVGLARPHIATPDLVRRARLRLAGQPVAPPADCIACNQGCTGRLELGLPISCVANPEVGLEREWRQLRRAAAVDAAPRRRVLVVGAGPAGLNAAVAAAEAGHRVTLRDLQPVLGGALRHAAQLSTRRRFALLVDQLGDRAVHHGVQIELGVDVGPADLDDGWDDIVLATGGRPDERGGDRQFPTVAVAELAADPRRGGQHVVLVDEEGSWTALALAEHLVDAGVTVTLLCAQPALAWRVPVYSKPAALDRLRGRGFTASLLSTPTAADPADGTGRSRLTCRDVLSEREWTLPDVSGVVFVRPPRPRLELADALGARGRAFTVVGDAYAPRTALEAAFEGRRAGFAVSSSQPGVREATMMLSSRL